MMVAKVVLRVLVCCVAHGGNSEPTNSAVEAVRASVKRAVENT